MAYSNDEKNDAVLRIVQGNPRFRRSSLATRRVDATSDEVSELIRTALFYEPDAVYYLAYLTSNYYTRTVVTAQAVVAELLDALDDLLVPDRPVEDISSLSEARRALQSIEAALAQDGAVGARGFTRYNAAITKSRDVIGSAVKSTSVPLAGGASATDIVRPRSQARSDANKGLASMKSLHASILAAVDLMLDAYSSYVGSGISTTVARTQVARARADLEKLEDELGALTASERTLRAREALLRIVANKGIVKAVADSPLPGEPKVSGTAYRAAAHGTGVAPFVEGTISAPWPLTAAKNLLAVDVGGALVIVDFVTATPNGVSTRASLRSGTFENFKIGPEENPYSLSTRRIATGGAYATADKTLYLIVDGVLYEVSFAGDRTAAVLAAEIEAAVPVVTASAHTVGGQDYVEIAYDNGLPPALFQNRYMRVTSGKDSATSLGPWRVEGPLGSVLGEYTKGCDATDELYIQVNDAVAPTVLSLTHGAWPDYTRTAAQVASEIIGGGFTASATPDGRVEIVSTLYGEGSKLTLLSAGSETRSHRTLRVLGFNQNDESRGESVIGRVVDNVMNGDLSYRLLATAVARRHTLLTVRNAVVTGLSQLTIDMTGSGDPTTGWTAAALKVSLSNGANHGVYGVTSFLWAAPNLVLNLNCQLVDQSATNKHSVVVYKELLRLTSKDAGTAAYIQIVDIHMDPGGSSAHALFGLPTTKMFGTVSQLLIERNDPVLGWVPADLSRSKIDVGDIVLSAGVAVATVVGVGNVAAGILDITPVAPSLSITELSVMSGDAQLHTAFTTALEAWKNGLSPFDDEALKVIDKVLAPILVLQNPSRDQVSGAYALVAAYGAKLTALKAVLDAFAISRIAVVDDTLRVMEEHGQDRARSLLLQGQYGEFFGVTARTASFSRALMDAASKVTVEDLNEPTMIRGEEEKIFQRVTAFWEEDTNPSLSVESEEPFPASPLINFWPDEK